MLETVCPKCGATEIHAENAATVCSMCGAQLPRHAAPLIAASVASSEPSKKLIYLIVGFGSAICLFLLAVVILLMSGRGAPSVSQPTSVEEAKRDPAPQHEAVVEPVKTQIPQSPSKPAGPIETGIFFAVNGIPLQGERATVPLNSSASRAFLVVAVTKPIFDGILLDKVHLAITDSSIAITPLYFGHDAGRFVENGIAQMPRTIFEGRKNALAHGVTALVFIIPRSSHGGALKITNSNFEAPAMAWTVPEPGTAPVVANNTPRNVAQQRPIAVQSTNKPAFRFISVASSVRGESWSHQLDGVAPGEICQLIKAPEGMTVNAAGVLAWQVPPQFAGMKEVVVEITTDRTKRVVKFPLNAAMRKGAIVVDIERLPGMTDAQNYLPLDGVVARAVVTRDGRYAVCGIPEKNRLAVVDLVEAAEIASIPWPVGNKPSGFAAGGDRVVAYDRDKETLNVYELKSGRLQNSFPNPFQNPICDLVMGRDHDDAVVCAATETRTGQIDAVSLPEGRRMNLFGKLDTQQICGYAVRMTAGSDLSVITARRVNVGPEGAILFQRTGNSYSYAYEHASEGILFPLSGNELAGSHKILGFNLKPSIEYATESTILGIRPVLGSDLLIGIGQTKVYYFSRNNPTSLREWTTLPGATSAYQSMRNAAPWIDRKPVECIQMSATVGRGYILPGDASGIIIVTSDGPVATPPTLATGGIFKVTPGVAWSEKIGTLGSTKGLTWELEKAPAGLTIAQDGTLNWSVPPDFHGPVECNLAIQGTAERTGAN